MSKFNVDIFSATSATLANPLPVSSGGSGVTSSTGTGSLVLSSNPSFTGTLIATSATITNATITNLTVSSTFTPASISTAGNITTTGGDLKFPRGNGISTSQTYTTTTVLQVSLNQAGGIGGQATYLYTPGNGGGDGSQSTYVLGANSSTVLAPATTQSTSTTTGALISKGGLAVAKDAFLGGYVNAYGVVASPGGLSTDGNIFFKYSRGTWTPTVYYSQNGSSNLPISGGTYIKNDGYYVKNGNLVTIWWDVDLQFDGTNNYYLLNPSGVNIGGLPYKCLNSNTAIDLTSSCVGTVSSFPNGIAVGGIPNIGFVVYPTPYTVIAYEQGAPVPVANSPFGSTILTWISDGYSLVVCGQAQSYGVAIGIPPYILLYSNFQPITNFNVLQTGTGYHAAFAGSLTYYTDS